MYSVSVHITITDICVHILRYWMHNTSFLYNVDKTTLPKRIVPCDSDHPVISPSLTYSQAMVLITWRNVAHVNKQRWKQAMT